MPEDDFIILTLICNDDVRDKEGNNKTGFHPKLGSEEYNISYSQQELSDKHIM